RTPDPQIRSLVLYPAELPVHGPCGPAGARAVSSGQGARLQGSNGAVAERVRAGAGRRARRVVAVTPSSMTAHGLPRRDGAAGRQDDAELGARGRAGGELQLAAIGAHELGGDGETEARALAARAAPEGLEQVLDGA